MVLVLNAGGSFSPYQDTTATCSLLLEGQELWSLTAERSLWFGNSRSTRVGLGLSPVGLKKISGKENKINILSSCADFRFHLYTHSNLSTMLALKVFLFVVL